MSSFSVLYNGQKKIVKVLPNELMQKVVVEAAEYFKLDLSRCTLLHKKTVIDKTQQARFCNIPNLAQIELKYNENTISKSSSIVSCKIALSVLNDKSCMGTFNSNVTILEMLQVFVDDGSLAKDILSQSPEVIYLRTSITGDALQTSTIGSLGLGG